MLRVIATHSTEFIDTVLRFIAPEKQKSNHLADIYRKNNTIYLFLKKEPSTEMATWIASEFLPDRLYFPFFGYSVDMIHEIGDVIVPNVFLGYSKKIENTDITKESCDHFIEKKMFIENFLEQKDYYVEDFGLSLGGILISGAPSNPKEEIHEKLMLAYEGDIYIDEDVYPTLDIVRENEVPTVILSSIIRGKPNAKHPQKDPYELAIKNILTTIDLLEDEGE